MFFSPWYAGVGFLQDGEEALSCFHIILSCQVGTTPSYLDFLIPTTFSETSSSIFICVYSLPWPQTWGQVTWGRVSESSQGMPDPCVPQSFSRRELQWWDREKSSESLSTWKETLDKDSGWVGVGSSIAFFLFLWKNHTLKFLLVTH